MATTRERSGSDANFFGARILLVPILLVALGGGLLGQEPEEPPAFEEPVPVPAGTGDAPPPDGSDAEMRRLIDESAEVAGPRFSLRGMLSLSYRGRTVGDSGDDDLYGYLSLDGGLPEVNDLTFHLFGRATYDLNNDARDGGSPFFSLNDVRGSRFDHHLYEAFVELRRSLVPASLGIQMVRLGRQNIYAGNTWILDGARIDFQPVADLANLEISIYGGIPEYLYESSRSGDWMAGIDIGLRPFARTRIDLRYVHAHERSAWLGGTERDHFASIALTQALGESASLRAEWTTIDAQTRDVTVRLSWNVTDLDLLLFGAYRYQDDIEHEFTTEYDPYFAVLGPSFAFHQVDLQATKLFGEHFAIDAGFTFRELDNDDEEGPFNREYMRGWLTLSTRNWPVEDLDLALTGEIWEGQADDALSAGFEAVWRASDALRLTGGVYYSLFKYDLFVLDEREDATTIFAKARYNVTPAIRLDGRYEFETGDEGDFHSVWVGVTWSF